MTILLRTIGILGILLISIGIAIKKRRNQDIFYIFGGSSLVVYSIYIKDIIFIILQIIFISVAAYDLIKKRSRDKFIFVKPIKKQKR